MYLGRTVSQSSCCTQTRVDLAAESTRYASSTQGQDAVENSSRGYYLYYIFITMVAADVVMERARLLRRVGGLLHHLVHALMPFRITRGKSKMNIKWSGARAGERSFAAESKYNVNCGPIAIQDSPLTFNSLPPHTIDSNYTHRRLFTRPLSHHRYSSMFRSSRGPLVVFTSAWGIGVVYGIALDCTLSVCARSTTEKALIPRHLIGPAYSSAFTRSPLTASVLRIGMWTLTLHPSRALLSLS